MNIIDLILYIWLTGVGLLTMFMVGDRVVDNYPYSKFAKWWRRNISSLTDKDEEQF